VVAAEVLLNSKFVSELIEKGDFSGVKEAMEKSMAEGSQTFEQDIARLIKDNTISRDEGMAHADSPTNLLWRLQNELTPMSRVTPKKEEPDQASFTEITLDVRPDDGVPVAPWMNKK
jgi:twitching motility protein PilU